MQQHKWEQAIADFNHALIVSPSFILAVDQTGGSQSDDRTV